MKSRKRTKRPTGPRPDLLLDVQSIWRRQALRENNPYRWRVATFTMPTDATRAQVKGRAVEKANFWIDRMEKTGWRLVTRPVLTGPFSCFDIRDSMTVEGMSEFRLTAVFRLTKSLTTTRIELPPGIVRQDPEQDISVHDAVAAG